MIKKNWTEQELIEEWSFSSHELLMIRNEKDGTHLCFAIKWKFFEKYGYMPKSITEIPEVVVQYISQQLQVDPDSWQTYNWQDRLAKKHNKIIRKHFKFTIIDSQAKEKLRIWLWETQFPFNSAYIQLSSVMYRYLYDLKIEPLSTAQMDRLLKSWYHKFEQDLFTKVVQELSDKDKIILDNLLKESEDTEISLNDLRQDPKKASVKAVELEVIRLKYIQQTSIMFSDFFHNLSPSMIRKYHDYVMSVTPSQISQAGSRRKYTLLACFCYLRGSKFIDNLIEIFLKLIHKINTSSKNKVMKEFWDNRRVIYNKDQILRSMAVVSVDKPRGIIEEEIYPEVGREVLKNIATSPQSFDEYYMERKYHYMHLSYSRHYRRILSPILNNLALNSNNPNNAKILTAINLVKKYSDQKIIYYPAEEEIPDIAPVNSRNIITKTTKSGDRVHRIYYELTLLKAIRNRLRCKDIWVAGAAKYRNPDEDLPRDFDEQREHYYHKLEKPQDVEEIIIKLQQEQDYWLSTLNKNIINNKKVKITRRGKKPWIKVSPIKPQAEPDNIDKLKRAILKRWPNIGLLDILKESEIRLEFTKVFANVASKEIMSRQELQHKIILCIFALATNTGLKRVSTNIEGITYADLKYIQKRYINQANLRNAINTVINGSLATRNQELFGNATISCACDSTKFSAWDQNLITEWHVRYKGPGIMVYWHVDRKSLCVYSQLKSCSSSEIVSMIEGIIKHSTDAEISKSYVDTHGQSLVAFAFSYLLNFALLPRLKNIGSERLYLPYTDFNNKQNIESVLSRAINWDLIRKHYDQMIQYAIALKLHISEPEALLKRFTANSLQHPVYQALQELGRVIKTIFLCQYLCSEMLRQEISEGLNVIESWNSVNNFIFYGKRSTISSNEQTSQELSVLSLHLLQSSLVYINTLMIQRVLSTSAWKNKLTLTDKRALSPLFYNHVNPYGTFKLDMQERIEI